MRYEQFSNIVIVPFQGSYPYCGGPIYPDHHPVFVRNCKGYQPKDSIPEKTNKIHERWDGEYIYGGPIVNHFGHFFAEFAHRLWVRQLEECYGTPVLFVQRNGGRVNVPSYVYEYLDLLGIENWYLVDKNICVEKLIVGEQGKQLGAYPCEEYLEMLEQRYRNINLCSGKLSYKLAVLRSHLQTGRLIGESLIEDSLHKEGYLLFKPENFSLKDQISFYMNADYIIFSEGSAIHLFDILPKTKAKVFVVKRRNNSKLAEFSLSPKVVDLYESTTKSSIIFSLSSYHPNPNALSFIDYQQVYRELKYYGFIKQKTIPRMSESAIKQDISSYVQYWLPQETPQSEAEKCTNFIVFLYKKLKNQSDSHYLVSRILFRLKRISRRFQYQFWNLNQQLRKLITNLNREWKK